MSEEMSEEENKMDDFEENLEDGSEENLEENAAEDSESADKAESKGKTVQQQDDAENEHLDEWERNDKKEVAESESRSDRGEIEEEPLIEKKKQKTKKEKQKEDAVEKQIEESGIKIYALRTTANREDQVMDFVYSNALRKKLAVYAVIRPHGMRGYIFLEAGTRADAEQAAFNVPYARGVLPNTIEYKEVEHMLEQVKHEINIQK